jgi:hypothetical protein
MTENLFTTLSRLDAAPAVPLSALERERRDQLLLRILKTEPGIAQAAPRPVVRKRRRARMGWASFGIATALVGAAAFGAVVALPHLENRLGGSIDAAASGPLTTTQLASWTGTPRALTAGSALAKQADDWCTTNLGQANGGGGAPTITNVDARGQVASMLYGRAGLLYYCVSGGDGTGLWEVVDQQVPAGSSVAADGILVDTAGSHGDGAAGLSYGVGFAGSDVAKVVLHEPGLPAISATLQNGHWTAWWPTPGDSAHGGPSGTITITTRDGASRTVSAASVYPTD